MVTGDEVIINTKDNTYIGATDPFAMYKQKVFCYTQDGILLVNADVSEYQAQALMDLPIIIFLFFILGLIFGVFWNKFAGLIK